MDNLSLRQCCLYEDAFVVNIKRYNLVLTNCGHYVCCWPPKISTKTIHGGISQIKTQIKSGMINEEETFDFFSCNIFGHYAFGWIVCLCADDTVW